jgi:hypothetical protein
MSTNQLVSFRGALYTLVLLTIIYFSRYFVFSGNDLHLYAGILSLVGWISLSLSLQRRKMNDLAYMSCGALGFYTLFYEGLYLLFTEFSESSISTIALRILLMFLSYRIMTPLSKVNPK